MTTNKRYFLRLLTISYQALPSYLTVSPSKRRNLTLDQVSMRWFHRWREAFDRYTTSRYIQWLDREIVERNMINNRKNYTEWKEPANSVDSFECECDSFDYLVLMLILQWKCKAKVEHVINFIDLLRLVIVVARSRKCKSWRHSICQFWS